LATTHTAFTAPKRFTDLHTAVDLLITLRS